MRLSDDRTERARSPVQLGRRTFRVGGFIDMNRNDVSAWDECRQAHATRSGARKPVRLSIASLRRSAKPASFDAALLPQIAKMP